MRSYLSSSLTTQQNSWIHSFEESFQTCLYTANAFKMKYPVYKFDNLKINQNIPFWLPSLGDIQQKYVSSLLKAVSTAKGLRQWSEIRHRM